ncbi:hypothetical protein LTR62_008115 [Meristemomyces frigidus]|uniref:Protein disulfide-isomerase n=1 Tax=Meristemomyces frigidus TaxID=1508187 RepID=A0AAN7YD33_9PEZI|nr:hypothetical protein LTR62_008115 [Meristemomyces frigidus]
MPIDKSRHSPDPSAVQRVAANALQSKTVKVERLEGYLYRTYRLTTGKGFFYLLRCRPSNSTRLLRHEEDRLDEEACALQSVAVVPRLVSARLIDYHAANNNALGSKYLITGPYSGAVFADVEPSFSRQALASVDRSLGQYVRQLAAVTGPAFGSMRQGSSFSSSSWTKIFTLILESVIRNGEDALINLPYDGMRDLLRRHRSSLDKITQPRLVVMELSADDDLVVDVREHQVTGLMDYSTAFWGDPFLSDCFCKPRESFVEGFGKLPNGDRDERIRQYLYVLYHSLLAVVRHHYRPAAESTELEARRVLTAAIGQLTALTRMKYTALGLLGLAALAAASDVHDLTGATFDDFVKENDLVLAEFFAPWCGHCKALAPEYEEAATELKSKSIALAKIDCTVEEELCKTQDVSGYPTLKIFRGASNVQPYGGPRKAQAIVSYMTKQSLPSVSLLHSADALEEFKTADKVVLVGFFAKDDKTSNATFEETADELRDSYLFGATSDPALAKAEGVTPPAVVLYKTFDEGKNTFEEGFTKDTLSHFAKVSSTPIIGEVGPETYAGYMAAGIPLAYIFAETADERASLAKTLKPIAEAQKGKLSFATIDATAFGQHAGNLNLEVGKWPAFAIQDTQKNQKFPFGKQGSASDLSAKSIGKFVEDFVAGNVEASVKSEPIPEKQDGPVTVIVAKNYQEIVMDNDKDVLVEFYAPWCGHCKALAPKYDELAGLYKAHSDKIVIAKVDATANDVPDEIQGFPTIKLFKAGSKDSPVDYSGSRTVDDLVTFIRDNGSHKIDVSGAEAASAEGGVETEGMPQQAPAATASGVAGKIADAAKGVAQEVVGVAKEALLDDEAVESHDEL